MRSESELIKDTVISDLLCATPGIETLAKLVEIDPADLSASARVDYLSALERQSSWLQACLQRAIVAVAGIEASKATGPFASIDDAEREDISSALRLSAGTAQLRIDVARTLVNHLPNVCSALATGDLSAAHATVIARESAAAIRDGLSEFAIFSIEERAIAYAEFHTPAQVAAQVRTVIAKFAPETFEDVAEKARDTRRVNCYNDADGMSTVVAILPAVDAQMVMKAIEAFILKGDAADRARAAGHTNGAGHQTHADHVRDAKSTVSTDHVRDAKSTVSTDNGTTGNSATGNSATGNSATGAKENLDDFEAGIFRRSAEMKRADALSAICAFALAASTQDIAAHRRPITISVTIDLPTLLGLRENPGQLAGYGAIPASVARALASDGKWKRFITDPETGVLLDYGRQTYEPPQGLIDFLIARDRTCRFPGCRKSAALSDLDHAQSWEDGGETSLENLGALCRRHHQLKTHAGWKIQSRADGSCTWTSPLGKIYQTPARSMLEAS
jgi:hypothetical protein